MNKFTLMVLTGCAPITGISAAEKPNLVIIHTDEHSFRTLSCYQNLMPEQEAFVWGKGCNSTTPNIDRIANEGAICMKYYCSSPVSTPSRASMITGLYPQATGAPKNGMFLSDKIPTFASILSENGYATSYVGRLCSPVCRSTRNMPLQRLQQSSVFESHILRALILKGLALKYCRSRREESS